MNAVTNNGSSALQEQLESIEKEAFLMVTAIQEKEVNERNSNEEIVSETQWGKRTLNVNGQWEKCRESYWKTRTESDCPLFRTCASCSDITDEAIIRCTTCKKEFCADCNSKVYISQPFHCHSYYSKIDLSSTKLLPVHFIDNSKGDIIAKEVPVPCFIPHASCPNCLSYDTISLRAGSKKKIVVTKEGRFDFNSTALLFSSLKCNYVAEFTEKDYISSYYWPGATTGSTYLFSEDLLEFCFHLKHQYLGPSQRKFIG